MAIWVTSRYGKHDGNGVEREKLAQIGRQSASPPPDLSHNSSMIC